MVVSMLMLLFLAIVQMCLWLYTRNVVTAAAAEAARYSGLADVSSGAVADAAVTVRVADRIGGGLQPAPEPPCTAPARYETRCPR